MYLSRALSEAKRWADGEKESVYARAARAYIDGTRKSMMAGGTKGLVFQLKYILINLRHWRGDVARGAKAAMREVIDKGYEEG